MINFFTEEVKFDLKGKVEFRKWLNFVIQSSGRNLGDINFIFTDDNNILEINKKYLNHIYFTDIITFNYNNGNLVSGDIFISIDTVRGNSELYNVSFEDEINRVMVHGVLHLIGFDDKDEPQQSEMRAEEDKWLAVYKTKSFLKSNH